MTSAEEFMPTEAIEKALAAIRRELQQQEAQRVELATRISAGKAEEHLLTQILAVRRGEKSVHPSASGNTAAPLSDLSSHSLPDVVAEELQTAGRPLHISDLMRLVKIRNVKIPGAGAQANLITYLRRDPRFARPARGLYALSDWGLDAMPPTRRRKRRRRAITKPAKEE